MFRVEVPIASAQELPELMSRMREWLDHKRLEAPFDCSSGFCRVDFACAEHAAAFADEFHGAVIGERPLPKGVAG